MNSAPTVDAAQPALPSSPVSIFEMPGIANDDAVPPEILTFLETCPKTGGTGGGVNRWIIRAARKIHPFFYDKKEMACVLRAAVAKCGRAVPDREIQRAIQNSSDQDGGSSGRISWPIADQIKISEVTASGHGVATLREMSPVHFDTEAEPRTEEIIDALFPGNPLLCAARVQYQAYTRPREEWRGKLSSRALIVPSPMSAVQGLTKENKPSPRALSNTGPRSYLVVEFDPARWEDLNTAAESRYGSPEKYHDAKRDEHAALLIHLSQKAPLALAVHSGGKSVHGWFHCTGKDEELLRRFMAYAVMLGADPATWTKCQFVRMPDGLRDTGRRQPVLYFNPAVTEN